jgi:hypothetical protein
MRDTMSRYNKKDWTEVVLIFFFLAAGVIAFGAVSALIMELIFRLI